MGSRVKSQKSRILQIINNIKKCQHADKADIWEIA